MNYIQVSLPPSSSLFSKQNGQPSCFANKLQQESSSIGNREETKVNVVQLEHLQFETSYKSNFLMETIKKTNFIEIMSFLAEISNEKKGQIVSFFRLEILALHC